MAIASPVSDQPRLLLHEPNCLSLFAWQNVDVAAWSGVPPLDVLDRMSGILSRRVRELGGPVSIVSLIRQVALPNEAARKAYKEFSVRHAGDHALTVFVFEHTGFAASALRAMLTSFQAFTRKQSTVLLAGSIAEVVAWLPERHFQATGVRLDAMQLARAIETVAAES